MKNWRVLVLIFVAIAACKKPYTPQVISTTNSYLVVEGIINSGNDSTIISLSHTVQLNNAVTANPELGATVTVESETNNIYALKDEHNGKYDAPALDLDNTKKYRLRVKTSAGKEYLSDLVQSVKSPPIDSVSFTIQNDGINIYTTTHDPLNNTHYYRWDYVETWIFRSNFQSQFKSNGDTVLRRDLVSDEIYTCWHTRPSTTIVLGSSAKLSKDVIFTNLLTQVSKNTEQLNSEYSILVRQFALTADGYNFYQNIKKNTEQLGSIFDAQPSQLKGNIHNTANATEPVIGFVSVGTTTTKRIFIRNRVLPAWPQVKFYPDCIDTPLLYKFHPPGSRQGDPTVNQIDALINYNRGAQVDPLIPTAAIQPPGAKEPVGYRAAEKQCVDCTLRGTNKQPSFWVY